MTTFKLTFNLTVMYSKAYRFFAGSYYQLIPLTIIIQACIGYIPLKGEPVVALYGDD